MTENQYPETLEPGIIFDHSHYPPEELNAEVIELAWRLGFRGRDAQDTRDIRRLMSVATGYDVGSGQATPHVTPAYFYAEADETVIAEHLTWVADDAEVWLNDHYAPEGHWIGNDGEAGAFGVWLLEDVRKCDRCGHVTDAGDSPDWTNGECEDCDPDGVVYPS